MAKCGACGKFLQPSAAATCATCPGVFHKGCVLIPESTVVPKDWVCPECKKKLRKGDNSSTPVKGLVPPATLDTVGTLLPNPEASTTGSSPMSAAERETREMRLELASYMSEMREIRKELGEIRGMKTDMASIQDTLNVNLLRISERLDSFDSRLGALENRGDASSSSAKQVSDLEETVAQLKLELNDRDQEALLADLDIGHLPETKGENVQHVVSVLAAKLGVTLEERDIVFAERVGPMARPAGLASGDSNSCSGEGMRGRRVIVRLARRQTRDELLRAARVRRNVTSADFGYDGPQRRVYINERLTRANRLLFQRVREECRRQNWRYSWTRRGRIFARQGDGKQAYPFRTDADFVRVFGTPTE